VDHSAPHQQKHPLVRRPLCIPKLSTNFTHHSATNENVEGALQSFDIVGSVLSSPVDTVPSEGSDPAFAVALSTGEVAIMNYSSGNGRIIPTTISPEQFGTDAPVITFPPPAGGVSHPHMALQHGKEIFVPDLVSFA
jgi:hypothetical protein